jgi:hypothetical protein
MNNTIIECRQVLSTLVKSNGDFRTILVDPVKVEEGDQIYIKTSYIDNRENSLSKISFEEDTKFDFYNYIYQVYWDNFKDDNERISIYGTNNPDNMKYILCQLTDGGDSKLSDYVEYTKINIILYTSSLPSGSLTINLNFSYIDLNGVLAFGYTNTDFIYEEKMSFPINVIGKKNSIKLTDTTIQALSNLGYKPEPFTDIPLTGIDILTPITLKTTITVEAGDYYPETLAEKISQKLTGFNSNLFNIVELENAFLKNHQSIKNIYNSGTVNEIYYVREDGNNAYTLKDASTLFSGSNQIALEFDSQNTQKFFWSYLHFPMYSQKAGTVGQIVNLFIPDASRPNNFFEVNKNAGILWSNLDSFFQTRLGFDLSTLTVKYEYNLITTGPLSNTLAPVFNLKDGVNTTGGFAGLDGIVPKNATFYESLLDYTNVEVSTQDTTKIYASQELNPNTLDSGYFIIEVDAGFQNEYIGEEIIKRNVQAITSKYYTAGSYTNGTTEDSIVYTHIGSPLYLSSFNIRILNPDFSLINNLGEDNTVFIQVVKSDNINLIKNKKKS